MAFDRPVRHASRAMSTVLKVFGVATLVVVAFLVGVSAGNNKGLRAANRESTAAAVDQERYQRLAGLIPPITVEIDRILATGSRDLHDLEMRRIEVQGEMCLEGCR